MSSRLQQARAAVHSFLLRRGILVTGYPLQRCLGLIKPSVVLDVGANVGQYGRELRDMGFGGVIHSFEPFAPAFRELERVAAASAPRGRWHVHNYGLGEHDGVREMFVARESVFNSLRRPQDSASLWHPGITGVDTTEVRLRTLDSVWQELGMSHERVFLKMDTQGSELEVLRGGDRALGDVAGIQLEVSLTPLYRDQPCIEDVVPVLRRAGFQFFGVWPGAGIRGVANQVLEVDVVLVRA